MSGNGYDTEGAANTVAPIKRGPVITAEPINGIGVFHATKRKELPSGTIVVTVTVGFPEETPADLQDTVSREYWLQPHWLMDGFDYHTLDTDEMKKYQANRGALDRLLDEFGAETDAGLEGNRVKFTSQPAYKDKTKLELKTAYKVK